jgi:hypothetical protein
MATELKHTESGWALIHLADNEWGNETMRDVARQYFDEQPECNFVEVYEHGGWYLGFRRDDSTWCTANDMAVLNKPKPRPTKMERVIRRGVDGIESDYWMLGGKTLPALKLVA